MWVRFPPSVLIIVYLMKLPKFLQVKNIKGFSLVLWRSGRLFVRDGAMNHSAALSYYTVFALPAILIVLISVVGYFWGEKDIEQQLFSEFSALMGPDGANMVKFMLDKFKSDSSHSATLTGIFMLLFSSTVVFYTIQHSLNGLWKISDEIKHGFVKYVIDKVLSLAFILTFGFLLMVSLGLQACISWMNYYFGEVMNNQVLSVSANPTLIDQTLIYLKEIYDNYFSGIFFFIEYLMAIVLNTLLFACIFKFLPDAKVKWKVVIPAGILTALLFEAGQKFIGWKLGHTDFSSSYGPAGAIIIVFVWIFYSSCIIFFGGIFVQQYGKYIGEPVKAIPGHHHPKEH